MKRLVMYAVMAAVALTTMIAADGRKADVFFQAGMAKETVQGDLNGAIAQYELAVKEAGADRALGARALLRIAECYEKLGEAQARKVYERLVRDFSDQGEAAETARTRLAQGGATAQPNGLVARQLWTGTKSVLSQAAISADGRTVATFDTASNDVAIRDLTTGRTTTIQLMPADSVSYPEWPVLSPDMKRLVYAWSGPEIDWKYQVRMIGMDRGAKPEILGGARTFPYCWVWEWSPDGKSILISTMGDARTTQIAWVSLVDGAVRTLKSLDWRSAGKLDLSPDGKFIAYDALIEQGAPDREIRVIAADGSSESVVVRGPGINQSAVWTRDGSRLLFTSNRSGTFGLWSQPVRNGKAAGGATLVKGDVGGIGLIGFTSGGSLMYSQAVATRDVFAVDLDEGDGRVRGNPARLVDTFVGANLNPAWSPDGKSIGYMSIRSGSAAGGGYVASLVIRSLETGQERVINKPFRYGSKPIWFPDGQNILEFARNDQGSAVLYKVALKTGEVSQLVNTGTSAPQALALSRDGRLAYVGAGPGAGLTIFDLATGQRTELQDSAAVKGIATSRDGRLIAFVSHRFTAASSRAWLRVANVDGSGVRTVLTTERLEDFPWSVEFSPDGRQIYFTRGRDGLNRLSRVDVAGGSPIDMGLSLQVQGLGSIDLSTDGRRLAYGAGGSPRIEMWALENLAALSQAAR